MGIEPGVLALLWLLYRLLPLFLSSRCSLVAILLPQGLILIMHSNTVALDSLPPILLTFSDLLLLFLFVLSMKFLVSYVLLIFSLNETLTWAFHLLPNWGEKSLTCQIPEEEGGLACLHLPNQNTTWSKTVSPLTLKVHLPWWAWLGVDENTDGLNIPCPKPSLEKPVCTHLCYPLLLAWQFWGGQQFHSRWDTSLGRAEYKHTKTKFLFLTISGRLLGNNFPQDDIDTPPKWHSQISFPSPNMRIDLCTKKSLPPAYSRLLWVCASSSPSQAGVIRPPLPPCRVGSSSPDHSVPLLSFTTC